MKIHPANIEMIKVVAGGFDCQGNIINIISAISIWIKPTMQEKIRTFGKECPSRYLSMTATKENIRLLNIAKVAQLITRVPFALVP